MDKQEGNDYSPSSRRLLPPLYPSSPNSTNVPRAGNSSHHNHYSRFHPFLHNPSPAAHSAYQAGRRCKAGTSSYQPPTSLLSRATYALAGVGGISNTVSQSQAILSGSECAAGSSSYQTPPSPQPQTHSPRGNSGGVLDGGGAACFLMPPQLSPAPVAMDTNPMLGVGHATFFSSADTGQAGVVDLAPLTCTQPPFSWSVDQASSEYGLPATLLTQSTASADLWLTDEYVLPTLPPALSGPPPMVTVANLEAGQYVDLEGPDGHLNTSGRDWDSTSTNSPCPPLPQPYSSSPLTLASFSSMPAPGTNFGVNKEAAVDWRSWRASQLENNTIANRGSLPAGVKKEPVDWSGLGKNTITSGGSSSAWTMPQPYSPGSTDLMVFGSKPNQLPSPVVEDFADGLFTQDDIDKIMGEKKLADIVLKDPKKVWSLLRNRVSAERSRQRRLMRVSYLEGKAEKLQQEKEWLWAQLHSLEIKNNGLTAENNEMMIKLNGFEHETQMRNALTETLKVEVHRLKLILGEIRDSRMSNSSYQERSPQTMQPEHTKKHNNQLAQLQRDQELREFEDFVMQ